MKIPTSRFVDGFTIVAASLVAAGCATTAMAPDLTSSVTAASSAATVVSSVNDDILRARLLSLVQNDHAPATKSPPSQLVCTPSSPSVTVAAKELGTYADAINMVGKVAAKPTDTSYAGYLKQFKKNQATIEAAPDSPDAAAQREAKQSEQIQTACNNLFTEDVSARLTGPTLPRTGFAITALPAAVASVDGLLKAILAGAEQVQRDIAIRRATQHMLATIQTATSELSKPPSEGDYRLLGPSGSPGTALGNAIAIHRWFAAQRVQADWTEFRDASDGDDTGRTWQAVDHFVTDAQAYRNLAATDPDKLLKQLKSAVQKASATTDKTSVGDIFDSLSSIGSAVSGIADKYGSLRKTIN